MTSTASATSFLVGDLVQVGEEQATVIDFYMRYPVLSYADGTEQVVDPDAISGKVATA